MMMMMSMDQSSAKTKLGGSLKVPSVHELVKQNPATVPPRYLRRPDQHLPTADSSLEIPVIDMQNLLSGDDRNTVASSSELRKLNFACKEWGFFQVINSPLVYFLLFILNFIFK